MFKNLVRFIYTILTYSLLPFYIFFWIVKGVMNNTYWDRINQRFGFGYPILDEGTIWIHAVSVGEVQASVPLVEALKVRYPDKEILITTVTPTGSQQIRNTFKDSVYHCYIPFETSFSIKAFFDAVRPSIALILETEIWPNLYNECGKRKIPLVLVSARISVKSLRSYKRLLPLFRETLSHGILIAAQSSVDAKRFISLGADKDKTWVMGNIKFDFNLPADMDVQGINFRSKKFGNRPVWIAASTHEGEELEILKAHRRILKTIRNMLLIIVPRHPERFAKVEQLLKTEKWRYTTRSSSQSVADICEVFLLDSIGELLLFYSVSDIAFVGGSLIPIGGHNLLEPASLSLPILTGIYMFNQQEMTDLLVEASAVRIVKDKAEIVNNVLSFHNDKEASKNSGAKARMIVEKNKGALTSLMRRLDHILAERIN